jgi:hypothetical protein
VSWDVFGQERQRGRHRDVGILIERRVHTAQIPKSIKECLSHTHTLRMQQKISNTQGPEQDTINSSLGFIWTRKNKGEE